MTYDIALLRAVLRLARTATPAKLGALAELAGGSPAHVRASCARLVEHGLLTWRDAREVRLTLPGLALAAATAPPSRSRARAKRLPRRRRAAGLVRAPRAAA